MSKEHSFVERCLAGDALPDDIDDFVDLWHSQKEGAGLPLHIFLGMDEHEYALWMRDPNVIYGILKARKYNRPVDDYAEDYYSMPLAARAESTEDTMKLTNWLRDLGKL